MTGTVHIAETAVVLNPLVELLGTVFPEVECFFSYILKLIGDRLSVCAELVILPVCSGKHSFLGKG